MIRKILGPPGTGKTTKLLHYVRTLVKFGTPLHRIGYFAFTKKAAGEAKGRMLDKHPELEDKDLPYFQTLHSFAFNLLGMKKSNVMQDEDYEAIGREVGIEVSIYSNGEETTGFLDSDSEYFKLISAARVKNLSIEDEFNTGMYSEDLNFETLKILKLELENRKQAFKLVDFTDIIDRFVESNLCPNFDVVFIDEAQDLSPIQWRMFDVLKKNSKHVILAGDDDQAIFGWAGADVERFQKEPAKNKVLPKSYRVPKSIQTLANKILDRIPDERRIKKTWQPRKEEGNVYPEVFSLEEVPLQEGNWLVIARTNRKLLDTIPALKSMGIYYEYKQRKSFSKKLYKAITNWTRWTKGETLTPPEVRDIFEYTTDKFHIDEHKTYKMSDFKLIGTARWFESFQIDLDDSLYIRKMLERGELLSREARVKLSTIHTAKGGEADNVLLILDSSKRTLESLQRSFEKQDEEHRVWYVGVTRAKQNLYLMAAKNKERSYDIESLQ